MATEEALGFRDDDATWFIFGKSIAAAEMNDDNGALDVSLQELLQVFRDVLPSFRRPHQPPAPVDAAGFTDNGGRAAGLPGSFFLLLCKRFAICLKDTTKDLSCARKYSIKLTVSV